MRFLALPACGLSLVMASVGCSPSRGFCEASADCDQEFFGVEVPDAAGNADDSVNVCVAEQDARQRALRANEEEECHALADAFDAYHACVASEFGNGEDGCDAVSEECEDEIEDLQDALEDVNGDECSSNEE